MVNLHLRGDISCGKSNNDNKRCIAAARVVQCAAISSSQCQSSNVTQPSHLHVVTRHGAQRRPAKVSCRHLAAGVKRSRRKTVSRLQYTVCMVSVHHSYTTDLLLTTPATDKAAGVMYGGRGTSSSPPGHSEHRHAHCCCHAAEWQIYCHNNINS